MNEAICLMSVANVRISVGFLADIYVYIIYVCVCNIVFHSRKNSNHIFTLLLSLGNSKKKVRKTSKLQRMCVYADDG